MNTGFCWHWPVAAQWLQFSSSSVQSSSELEPGEDCRSLLNALTRIHLVAVHFSPSRTMQLPRRLLSSTVVLWWRLKNKSASPLTGFTAYPVAAQSDHVASFACVPCCWKLLVASVTTPLKVCEMFQISVSLGAYHLWFGENGLTTMNYGWKIH